MERLLTVREAAAFLQVSEMTIRRWTNDGSLLCYRIGGRRPRRFRVSDLEYYLKRSTDTASSADRLLGMGGLSVPDGSHLTHLSTGEEESMKIAASFIFHGLIQQETVMMVCPETVCDSLLQILAYRGIDVRMYRDIGMLKVRDGQLSASAQLGMIAEISGSVPGRFRLFGEMTWTLEQGWSFDQIRQLEIMAHERIRPAFLFLCQYPLVPVFGPGGDDSH